MAKSRESVRKLLHKTEDMNMHTPQHWLVPTRKYRYASGSQTLVLGSPVGMLVFITANL